MLRGGRRGLTCSVKTGDVVPNSIVFIAAGVVQRIRNRCSSMKTRCALRMVRNEVQLFFFDERSQRGKGPVLAEVIDEVLDISAVGAGHLQRQGVLPFGALLIASVGAGAAIRGDQQRAERQYALVIVASR